MAILLLAQKRSFTDAWRLEMCPAAVRPCVLPGAGVPERGASCSRAGSQRGSCCGGKAGARRSAELYVRCRLSPAAIRVTLELKVFELDESMAGGVKFPKRHQCRRQVVGLSKALSHSSCRQLTLL